MAASSMTKCGSVDCRIDSTGDNTNETVSLKFLNSGPLCEAEIHCAMKSVLKILWVEFYGSHDVRCLCNTTSISRFQAIPSTRKVPCCPLSTNKESRFFIGMFFIMMNGIHIK